MRAAEFSIVADRLEERLVLSSFTVVSLSDAGAGSLRQAILDANAHAGADEIKFDVAGTINITSGALPDIVDQLDVNGHSAPGFGGTPTVEVDFNGFAGLNFTAASAGSKLRSLGIVDATGHGVTFNGGDNNAIVGNFIGIRLDGTTAAGNTGNGLSIVNSSGNSIESNLIGANGSNGVGLYNGDDNQIALNYIGTDVTGNSDLGNGANGIFLTNGSTANEVGTHATGPDDAVGGSFVSPLLGNLISGNNAHGVYITNHSDSNTVSGNLIGVNRAGTSALGNSLAGVRVDNSSGNVIGHTDQVTGIDYYNTDQVTVPVNGWQGIRGTDVADQYMITGTSGSNALYFQGTIEGVGTPTTFLYPGSTESTAYSPDITQNGDLRVVGTYRNSDSDTAPVAVNGFVFQGTVAELTNPGADNFQTINHHNAKYNYVHSTMGGLVVGNYDKPDTYGDHGLEYGPSQAFIYDLATDTFLPDVVYPGSNSNSAYGIWYNGGTSYTIVGGYSMGFVANFDDQDQPIGTAYMVDFDSSTREFSNWTSFTYPQGHNVLSHFESISSVEKGVYTLAASTAQIGVEKPGQGS